MPRRGWPWKTSRSTDVRGLALPRHHHQVVHQKGPAEIDRRALFLLRRGLLDQRISRAGQPLAASPEGCCGCRRSGHGSSARGREMRWLLSSSLTMLLNTCARSTPSCPTYWLGMSPACGPLAARKPCSALGRLKCRQRIRGRPQGSQRAHPRAPGFMDMNATHLPGAGPSAPSRSARRSCLPSAWPGGWNCHPCRQIPAMAVCEVDWAAAGRGGRHQRGGARAHRRKLAGIGLFIGSPPRSSRPAAGPQCIGTGTAEDGGLVPRFTQTSETGDPAARGRSEDAVERGGDDQTGHRDHQRLHRQLLTTKAPIGAASTPPMIDADGRASSAKPT